MKAFSKQMKDANATNLDTNMDMPSFHMRPTNPVKQNMWVNIFDTHEHHPIWFYDRNEETWVWLL